MQSLLVYWTELPEYMFNSEEKIMGVNIMVLLISICFEISGLKKHEKD